MNRFLTKVLGAGLAAALLTGPVLAQGSVPRLDGVQTPGPAADNQTGSGPLSAGPGAYFDRTARLDGVQTPAPGADNQTGSGPIGAGGDAQVGFAPLPELDGVPSVGRGR